ncbi:MAG: rhomboid family intramembrane serine protease [Rudaea sp.]|nr:rhomboid family intramembrane serine protease [Rudaea sp.]
MGFLVYGNDVRTGEVAPRFISNAPTEAEARVHGTERGMAVTAVVPCADDRSGPDLGESAATYSQVESEIDAPVIEAREFRRELLARSPHVYVTNVLIAANCVVFLAMAISGISPISPVSADLVGWGANWGPRTTDGEWWRLVSSLFIHIGIVHLLANMLAFALVAPTVERMVGSTTFLLLYLIAGIGGGLLSVYWSPLRPEAGASGAIFGIYGVLVGLLLRERGSLGKQTQLKSFLFYFLSYNLLYSFLPNVSLTAHLGGFFTGFFGTFMVVRGPLPTTARREATRNIFVVFYGLALVALAGAALHYRYGQLGPELINSALASERQTPDATRIVFGILELVGTGFGAFMVERALRDIILGSRSCRWPDTLGRIVTGLH